MGEVIKTFWRKFARKEGLPDNGKMSLELLAKLMDRMGEVVSRQRMAELFTQFDVDRDGSISLTEFTQGACQYLWENRPSCQCEQTNLEMHTMATSFQEVDEEDDADEEEDDEEDELSVELAHLSPEEQQSRLMKMAFTTMGIGTLLVVVLSDPMTDVLSELGNRTGIPPFYVSFVVAPLASNASELITSYTYALKKTQKSISISLQALQGAACMNNTFCLAIFIALVFFQGLAWEYCAETLAILVCQIVVAMFSRKRVQTLTTGIFVLMMYPGCLFLVSWLESRGYD